MKLRNFDLAPRQAAADLIAGALDERRFTGHHHVLENTSHRELQLEADGRTRSQHQAGAARATEARHGHGYVVSARLEIRHRVGAGVGGNDLAGKAGTDVGHEHAGPG